MNKEILNKELKELEKDIDTYCGDYGTLEHQLEYTLYHILNILKIISNSLK